MQKNIQSQEINDFFDQHKAYVYKLINHYILVCHYKFDKETIGDMVHYAKVGIFKGILTYKKNKKTTLKTYVFTCIRNEILEYIKDRIKNTLSKIDYSIDALYEDFSINDNDVVLDKYLSKLDKKDKDFLVMRYFGNMTFKEIGNTFGVCTSEASRRIHNALEDMRVKMVNGGISPTDV